MKKLLLITFLFIPVVFINCSEESAIVKPEIRIKSVTVPEGTSDETQAELTAVLSQPIQEDIVISYFTEDISANAGKDYTAVNQGSLTISAGSTSAKISITVLPDDLFEFTEEFLVKLTEPDNATLIGQNITVRINDNDDYTPEKDADGYITPDSYPEMTLFWAEEFNGTSINTDTWTFEIGDGCPNLCGWGNNELQYYSDEEKNAKIADGKLIITALKKEGYSEYSSARMITKGKQEFSYGRIDIRARLPYGQGIWPAIWMLGANIDQVGWPSCGEIDIMELVGHEPKTSHGTAHYNANGYQYKGMGYALTDGTAFNDQFHVFSVLWEKDIIKWYVDYNKFFEISAETVGTTYPFNNPFFFILNIAVGGNWPGNPDETTLFPQTMEIDYIRVFQQG